MISLHHIPATSAAVSSSDYAAQASLFRIIALVSFALAIAFLAFAIFAFIKFKIPKVIGDLSGRNAKKSIAQMRAENEKTGKKSFRPHPIAADRGTVTETIDNPFVTKKTSAVEIPDDDNATERLNYDSNGTEVLGEGTQILSEDTLNRAVQQQQDSVRMIMLQNIVFVHTDETI